MGLVFWKDTIGKEDKIALSLWDRWLLEEKKEGDILHKQSIFADHMEKIGVSAEQANKLRANYIDFLGGLRYGIEFWRRMGKKEGGETMDFKVFSKKLLSMCNNSDCEQCKLGKDSNGDCIMWCLENPDKAEQIVKDWHRDNVNTLYLEL